jgi:hypothetical protein
MKRTTLILIILALGLGGFVYFHEIKEATQQEEVKEDKQPIFTFAADDVQSLVVNTKDITLNLERSDQSESQKWFIKSPISEPANDAIVSYLLDLLVKGKREKALLVSPNELNEFGLNESPKSIDIKLKNQQTHRLILGKPNFNNSFLYAQADPSNQINDNIKVLLVSTDFLNAVNRDLSEWKEAGKSNNSQPLPDLPKPSPTNSK